MAYTADYSVPYVDKLSAMREKNIPHWWNEEAFQLPGSADILNDPAFSLYDMDKLRTYKDDPYIRDLRTLNEERELNRALTGQHGTLGYTYKSIAPTDPEKIYVDELDQFKTAVGPLAEQEKQGAINKELATTIAHEFRHNLFAKPEYSGIIKGAYDKFGGNYGKGQNYDDVEEMVNTAADLQLNEPEYWAQNVLDDFQHDYNLYDNDPQSPWAGYETVPTTSIFNNAATAFFDKVRNEKIKQKQKQERYSALQAGIAKDRAMIPGDGRVFQPTGGGGTWSPSGADLSPGGGYGQSPTGSDIAGTPFSRGGILGAF